MPKPLAGIAMPNSLAGIALAKPRDKHYITLIVVLVSSVGGLVPAIA
jgi:hypothetical protein